MVEVEFSVTPIEREGVLVLVLEGDLAIDTAPTLEQALDDRNDSLPVIVDITSVRVLGSSGLNALLRRRLAGIVRAPGSSVSRVLDLVRADLLVPVFDDLAAAVNTVTSDQAQGDPEP
jgi:anti-anti-sigma regulatory factor